MTEIRPDQPTRSRPLRVLIAGGGTGGHLYPGLAVAEALRTLEPQVEIRFAGSRRGLEAREVPRRGYRLYTIPVRGLFGVSRWRRFLGLSLLPLAFFKSLWVLLTFRPHLVLGVGGYASGPILATALLLGRRCVLQEQNAYPGITNRLLGRFVRTAFTTVTDAHGFFPRAIVTGNPVRHEILALRTEAPAPDHPSLPPQIFILGGSLGARAINKAVTEALPLLAATGHPPRIVHQTGRLDIEWVSQAYSAASLEARVTPFLEDIASVYRDSALVISRAGASAVGEFIAARKPSVLIPIPGTSGEHQLHNAQRLVAAGAAILIPQAELTPALLVETLQVLLADPQRRVEMAKATDALYPGDAAQRIALECLKIMEPR
ncbi:MAG: undecaprenyldiphospho-muramoylpentapeptide beta-N-acetylglucosaminyltransferase [Deltaproteobacteria bacterium]|nr:undecaprenyldiphospho-muramoylpentapeptide beta-N-acetylglucosaminyltransferase [Deltaproteobacteria bacterium]